MWDCPIPCFTLVSMNQQCLKEVKTEMKEHWSLSLCGKKKKIEKWIVVLGEYVSLPSSPAQQVPRAEEQPAIQDCLHLPKPHSCSCTKWALPCSVCDDPVAVLQIKV